MGAGEDEGEDEGEEDRSRARAKAAIAAALGDLGMVVGSASATEAKPAFSSTARSDAEVDIASSDPHTEEAESSSSQREEHRKRGDRKKKDNEKQKVSKGEKDKHKKEKDSRKEKEMEKMKEKGKHKRNRKEVVQRDKHIKKEERKKAKDSKREDEHGKDTGLRRQREREVEKETKAKHKQKGRKKRKAYDEAKEKRRRVTSSDSSTSLRPRRSKKASSTSVSRSRASRTSRSRKRSRSESSKMIKASERQSTGHLPVSATTCATTSGAGLAVGSSNANSVPDWLQDLIPGGAAPTPAAVLAAAHPVAKKVVMVPQHLVMHLIDDMARIRSETGANISIQHDMARVTGDRRHFGCSAVNIMGEEHVVSRAELMVNKRLEIGGVGTACHVREVEVPADHMDGIVGPNGLLQIEFWQLMGFAGTALKALAATRADLKHPGATGQPGKLVLGPGLLAHVTTAEQLVRQRIAELQNLKVLGQKARQTALEGSTRS